MSSSARILLVEDDPDAAEFLAAILREGGYEVESVGDGNAAIEAIRRRPPDLLLLDLMLPGKDGFQVAREVAAMRPGNEIPIVVHTALSPLDTFEARLGEIPGIRRCLYKPCRAKTILEVIGDVLRSK